MTCVSFQVLYEASLSSSETRHHSSRVKFNVHSKKKKRVKSTLSPIWESQWHSLLCDRRLVQLVIGRTEATFAVLSYHHSEWLSSIIWYRCCKNVERNMRGCAWYTRCQWDTWKKNQFNWPVAHIDSIVLSLFFPSRTLHSTSLITVSQNELMRRKFFLIEWHPQTRHRTVDYYASALLRVTCIRLNWTSGWFLLGLKSLTQSCNSYGFTQHLLLLCGCGWGRRSLSRRKSSGKSKAVVIGW